MKRSLILSAVMLFASACPALAKSIVIKEDEFRKVESTVAESIKQAMEDFDAVVEGEPPIFAIFDAEAPLPSDGGTTYYLGRGYKLTILKSLASIGGVQGYFYGPVIAFDEKTVGGNVRDISSIQFYSMEAFGELQR